MTDSPLSKDDAQARADQITAFRAEIVQLAADGLPPAPGDWMRGVTGHHDALLAAFARDYDIDRTIAERQMSTGMRLASLFGAVTLTAAIVSFAYRYWGTVPTAVQVTLLTLAPILALVAMVVAGHYERTRYVSALLAIVACGAFVVQTVLIGQIFNLHSSPHVLPLWGGFALAVAIPWRFTLPFVLGVFALVCYVAAAALWLAGVPWTRFAARPELVMVVAALALPVSARFPRELVTAGRMVLLALALGALLLLTAFDGFSLLPLGDGPVKAIYQVVAVLVASAGLAAGLMRAEDDVVLVTSIFAGVFLLTRFVDWWWAWMPRYLFFLILAGVALAWLWGLRVARRHVAERHA